MDIMRKNSKKIKQNIDEKTKEKVLYSIYYALENTRGIGEKRKNEFIKNYEKSINEILDKKRRNYK